MHTGEPDERHSSVQGWRGFNAKLDRCGTLRLGDLALSMTGQHVDRIAGQAWRRAALALLMIAVLTGHAGPANAAGAQAPPALRDTVTRHIEAGELVQELRHDGIRWNAMRALSLLYSYGEDARPALEAGLAGDDPQQRIMSAYALRRLPHGGPDPEPSDALLRVTIEGLALDPAPNMRVHRLDPLQDGMRFLLRFPDLAQPRLVEALQHGDRQQRFAAAFILGTHGRQDHVALIAPVLIPHLADNDIRGDAVLAGSALYRLGGRVIPALDAALPEADQQQRELIALIKLDLSDPPRTEAELRARKKMHSISVNYHDPILQFRFDRGRPFRGLRTWAELDPPMMKPSLH